MGKWIGILLLATLGTVVRAADYPSEQGILQVDEMIGGLEHPWSLTFLPDDQGLLITERPGRLRRLDASGRLSPPIDGVPAVYARGQGGLLDVALSPDFKQDRQVYLAYAEAGDGKAGTAVGRGRLSDDGARLEDFQRFFQQQPKLSTGIHFGARLVFDRDATCSSPWAKTISAPPPRTWTSCRASWCACTPMAACRRTTPS